MTRREDSEEHRPAARWERLEERVRSDGIDPPWPVAGAVPIGEHASTRRFFRLLPAGVAEEAASLVLVLYDDANDEAPARYERTAEWLRRAGVRTPRIHQRGRSTLLVEDGGDRTLDRPGLTDERRRRAYRRAVHHLGALQRHGRATDPPNRGWALDRERLGKELAFAEEHAAAGWLRIEEGRTGRESAYARIVDAVASLPTVSCHRDYHARNLLVLDDDLMVIDFQDLMTGPILYDAASLLWDNYCAVDEELAADALARHWRDVGLPSTVRDDFAVPDVPEGLPAAARQAFCLVAAQRHLKALGTFGFQVTRGGRPDYARFAPRTLAHARRALEALGDDAALAALAPVEERLPAAVASGRATPSSGA